MSESCCGSVAIEALVTVCRAMSQLEMGKLAVTSFGKKGNIRLLHDFDQPFTGEAGVKVSVLSILMLQLRLWIFYFFLAFWFMFYLLLFSLFLLMCGYPLGLSF